MSFRVYDPATEAIVGIEDLPSVRGTEPTNERARWPEADRLTTPWVRLFFERHAILDLAPGWA